MFQNVFDEVGFFLGYLCMRDRPGLNDFVEIPTMRRLLPDVRRSRILDIGCGAGHLSYALLRLGAASVTAIDPSENMLDLARSAMVEGRPAPDFVRAAAETFEAGAGCYDLVISALALHYVEDYPGLVAKIARWLTPGGVFLSSMRHPMLTASHKAGWCRDEAGAVRHWPLTDYSEEGRREYDWIIEGVVNYHRTVSSLVNTLIDNGLAIVRIEEPPVPADLAAARHDLAAERMRPPFLFIKAQKAAAPLAPRAI